MPSSPDHIDRTSRLANDLAVEIALLKGSNDPHEQVDTIQEVFRQLSTELSRIAIANLPSLPADNEAPSTGRVSSEPRTDFADIFDDLI